MAGDQQNTAKYRKVKGIKLSPQASQNKSVTRTRNTPSKTANNWSEQPTLQVERMVQK
jgi:hypothetical protein